MQQKTLSFGYISLKEASEISGYHPDYLSYLIRKGKLEGKRIGRDWFTTQSALENYLLTKKFFSLQEILFSKINPKKVLFSLIAVIIILVTVFLIFSPFSFQKIKEDFNPQELQRKRIGTMEATTYFLEKTGEIEISLKPHLRTQEQTNENSLFQRIKNFFNYVFSK